MNIRLKYIITSRILHVTLSVLSAYAICCCGLHVLPELGVAEDPESINNIFLSLSLSYVSGFVIYILTSVLPRKQREKEILELWKPHLSKLYNDMSERIEEVRAFVGIPKDKMDSLTVEDCEPLARYTDLPSEVWINRSYYMKNTGKMNGTNGTFSIKKMLNWHQKSVHHVVDIMLNNPMAIDADKRLLDILSQIKTSSFIAYCNSIIDSSCLKNPPISINNTHLQEPFCEYVKLRDKLGTFPIEKCIYEVRLLTDEEVKADREAAKKIVESQGFTMDQVRSYGQIVLDASRSNKR